MLPRAALIAMCLFAAALTFVHYRTEDAAVSAAPEGPVIALTFDDGPYAGVTARILDVIEENGVTATFFVPGCRVEGRGEILRRMEAAGCEIGSHGYSHTDLTVLCRDEIISEIKRTDDAFIAEIGHAPKLLRPPYGHYNATVRAVADRPLVLWTIDTEDWRKKDPSALAEYVIDSASEGCVILMHDQQPSTADAMGEIIPALVKAGFRFVTVSQLIEETGGEHKAILLPG